MNSLKQWNSVRCACCAEFWTVQGISLIEDGIKNLRAVGGVLCMPYFLALKAEALHLVHRTAEALGSVINATTPARVVVP